MKKLYRFLLYFFGAMLTFVLIAVLSSTVTIKIK